MTIRVPPAEAAYVDSVVRRLRAMLGEELIGVYPTGSLALDGYTPGRSDIDLIAVVDRTPPPETLTEIASRLAHDRLPCPATGLEFVLYPSGTARAGRVDAGYVLDLNTGRELPSKVSLDPSDGPGFWYAIDRSITCQSGTALTGPDPRTVLRPVPFDALLPVVVESIEAHLAATAEHGDNSVLNGCRALRFAAQRRWHAKPDAARWARSAAPAHAGLIDAAIASHAAGRAAGRAVPAAEVAAFLGYVLSRLRAASQ
ncbi:aminoglycoside adenylyltransferase domain-containing protein [Micromonospora sonneratiae]|uniref:Aminoglycoside adenylyltransferase domain-containing protein n=1 Tax=Micromonospora sonneratiae TaxID=1184706 RepID=A0ABW3Y6Y3_9ACTN